MYTSFSWGLGNPAPLAIGAFATSILSVSIAMMGFRGVTDQTVFVGGPLFCHLCGSAAR
ncbi:hypothetical protein GE09DRAFT_1091636 [Coniochaeta sp. 2T2.1]|nr:hypothetical protein GE09DRAFT_1091636 [Coniochaeta sp. 2T2.1]